ncbi:MAG: uncharacterized membrane protein YjfL (UPF0719 family) [Verrucomicrobiales bacterium]|jgi:uncharacterized membrane protein YjfL (UPF0719 family)
MEIAPLLYNILLLFVYGISGAIVLAISLGILMKVWNWITPIDEWEQLKGGNIAVAIVTGAVIIALALIIASAISPGS